MSSLAIFLFFFFHFIKTQSFHLSLQEIMNLSNSLIEDLKYFLNSSPTSWHAVEEMIRRLKESGFVELKEEDLWSIQNGKAYFVQRNRSSLSIFITPHSHPKRVRLFASHTDSPALKLKPNSEMRKNGMISFGVEVYGGPLLTSWLNRDLKLAGRIVYKNQQAKIIEKLIQLDQHPFIIPQLAIHLDREINEKGLILNKQDHLNVLAALETELSSSLSYLETLIREKIPDYSQLIDFDLFFVPIENARLIGYKQEMLASYRVDSLTSVHAIFDAFIQSTEPHQTDIKMAMFWDNEEVGSSTAQGADSPFFKETFERILNSLKMSRDEYFRITSQSTCISIDLAHGSHPNHLDKHDNQHRPVLGQGVVIKYNAQQKYATSPRSSLPIHLTAEAENIPLQKFVSRNDMPCGSTIGPIQASQTGMPTVDIGCGQLSMHSCREILSCQDQLWLSSLLKSLLQIERWPEIESISDF